MKVVNSKQNICGLRGDPTTVSKTEKIFGKRLRELRKQKDMTQEELGNLVNLSSRVIGYYESDRNFPNDVVLVKLADIFHVSLDYMLGRTEIQTAAVLGITMEDFDMLSMIKNLNIKADDLDFLHKFKCLIKEYNSKMLQKA